MKYFNLLIIILLSINLSIAQKKSVELAYRKDGKICIIDENTKAKSFLPKLDDICLSPDGLKLAATKNTAKGDRYVAIVDLETRKETRINIKCDNFYMADWSADGEYLLMNVFVGDVWTSGWIKADNTSFQYADTRITKDLFAPVWLPDSKHFVAQNMSTVFTFNLKGEITDSFNIEKTMGKGLDVSSDSRFWFTPDEKNIVFNSGTDEQMDEVEGPVEALFEFNQTTKKLERLTPKGMYASNPFLESNAKVLFSGFYEKNKETNIYRLDLITKKIELLEKNGMWPTGRKKYSPSK